MLPLPPAFVAAADPARLAQFHEAWRAVGLPGCVAKKRARIRSSYAAAFAAALRHPATVAGSATPPREEVSPCP